MSFLHPEYLYYFLPFIFIVFGFLFLKKEVQTHYFSQEIMDKLRVGKNTLSLKVRNILFFFISVLLVIGLAEPVIKDGKVEVKSKSADIVIALDISDSMLAEDIYPNRLKFAKEKAIELLKIAPNERIGIVGFAKNSYLVSPMSFDHDAVGFLLKQLSTDSITEKGTNFLSLLSVVANTIETTTKKNLLILSDGGDSNDFSEEIADAKEKNIAVYVLGIGTVKGAPIKKEDGSFITHEGEVIVSKLNDNIASFATSTGGVYIQSVKSNSDVKAMLREIERGSEKKELKSEVIEKFIPLFYYPIALAILLLLIATSSFKRNVSVVTLVIAVSLGSVDLKAGLLDFLDLKEAKEAYKLKEYEKAQEIYAKYAQDTNSSQSFYNQGNALYKQEKYDEAIQAYQQTNFDDNLSQANALANIGNTYVKQGKEKALENAIESYEKSLALKEDKEVRENLELVKKELEKQKEKEKQQEDKQENKEQDKKNEDQKENKESDDKQEGNDSEEDKKENSQNKQENKEKQNKEDKDSKEDEDSAKEEQDSKDKKDDVEELDKDKEEQTAKEETPSNMQKVEMSDAEQEKWLNKLNEQQNTYMYMLNDNQHNEENLDEKPW